MRSALRQLSVNVSYSFVFLLSMVVARVCGNDSLETIDLETCSEGEPLVSNPRDLARCELEHTSVVCVVHVISDRIQPNACRARVTTQRTVEVRNSFRRSIGYGITRVVTATLEGVIEAKPMSDLMNRNVALVVRRRGTTW